MSGVPGPPSPREVARPGDAGGKLCAQTPHVSRSTHGQLEETDGHGERGRDSRKGRPVQARAPAAAPQTPRHRSANSKPRAPPPSARPPGCQARCGAGVRGCRSAGDVKPPAGPGRRRPRRSLRGRRSRSAAAIVGARPAAGPRRGRWVTGLRARRRGRIGRRRGRCVAGAGAAGLCGSSRPGPPRLLTASTGHLASAAGSTSERQRKGEPQD